MYDKIDKNHTAWKLLKKALPSYRKRSAYLAEVESVILSGRFWSGGSRDEYTVIGIDGTVKHLPGRNDFPFTAPDERIELHTVQAVIQHGTFCGKPSTASVYIYV
jgi:hypothetical protein